MKIHSDVITTENIDRAAKRAGVAIVWEKFERVGSRSRRNAFVVHLTGSSRYRGGWSGNYGYQAATWDEWGMFLADLFDLDPAMHCGKNSYLSADHFHWSTGDRYRTLTPPYQHEHHRWGPGESVCTGSYFVQQCEGCEATRRYMAYGHRWEEIAA